jgi:O-antigen ligase
VGTGDVRDALDQRNEELGNLGVVEHSLNSHNQYLNTGVQLGLVGLLPMFFAFLTSFAIAIRKRNLILFITTSTFVLTMLFESFLETQAGLIPVTLFLLLLSLKVLEKDKEHIQT